jgi:outer membrane protein assembly factor BamA
MALAAFVAAAGVAAEPPGASAWSGAIPNDEVLESRGAVIGDVHVVTDDVFDADDPRENNRIYRLTNRLHRTTRPEVVRRQLLFAEGDPFSRRILDESERILRRNRYLYDAEIRVVGYRHNRVDVEVRTRDVWTLRPGLSIGRSGGVSSTDAKLQDHNVLGTGASVTLKHTSDVDRDVFMARYEQENFLGRWLTFKLEYGDSSDGGTRQLELARPFYSLDSRWSAGFQYLTDNRIESVYALGEIVDQFGHRERRIEVNGGMSPGLVGGRSRRWIAGLTYEEHHFTSLSGPFRPPSEESSSDGRVPQRERPRRFPGGPKSGDATVDLPADRTLAFPWIGFESVGDDYAEAHLLDQVGRTEDVALGFHYRVRLGYAAQAFGASHDAAIADGRLSAGFRFGERQWLLLAAAAGGRWGKAGGENVRLGGNARYYWRNFGPHLFFARVEFDAVDELDPEDQLLLGGDSGLRGYPLRYQDGEQRLLVSLEQRFFTDFYPLRLFYVSAAVFVDVGRTWGEGRTPDLGLLRDAGFGLRLSSSRSGLGSVVHFDVAFPLDGDDSIERVQWLVSTKKSF